MNEPMKVWALKWIPTDDDYWETSFYRNFDAPDEPLVIWRSREDAEAFAVLEAQEAYDKAYARYLESHAMYEANSVALESVRLMLRAKDVSEDLLRKVYEPKPPAAAQVAYKAVEVELR